MSVVRRSGAEAPGRRRGASAVEVLVVVVLTGIVVRLSWGFLERHSRIARQAESVAARVEAVRTLRTVLGEELRQGMAGRDWGTEGGDSIGLRAFRGVARICLDHGDGVFEVDYRGSRRPAPVKDSVLLLDSSGRWTARNLEAVSVAGDDSRPDPCTSGETGKARWSAERWTVPDAPEGGVLLRLFESGAYHLGGGAFRYRTGAGGRQPLTDAVLRDGASSLTADPGPIRLRAGFRRTSLGDTVPAWELNLWPPRW